MSYVPETQWIGGTYPGIKPKHYHFAQEKVLVPWGDKRKAILVFLAANPNSSPTTISAALGYSVESTRSQLREMYTMKKVAREQHKRADGRSMESYYSGVKE